MAILVANSYVMTESTRTNSLNVVAFKGWLK